VLKAEKQEKVNNDYVNFLVGGAPSRRFCFGGGVNRAAIFETRREYVHVGLAQTSMFATVSKSAARFTFEGLSFCS
jgi:hypothetical protein